jgi:hypothetical protein
MPHTKKTIPNQPTVYNFTSILFHAIYSNSNYSLKKKKYALASVIYNRMVPFIMFIRGAEQGYVTIFSTISVL